VLTLFTYAILRLQGYLPMNPRGLAGIGADGAMNTAIAFVTNTNWQWYAGESVLTNLSQMVGLTIHNFLSAATGIAVAFALFRGFARRETGTVGNFWADCAHHALSAAPASLVYALFLIASGVPQTFASLVDATRWKGPSRPSCSARSPARKRSRCSAPMVAASSTPTRPIRSKTPPR
jgi:K+-transporting ATPase ATPase A chain